MLRPIVIVGAGRQGRNIAEILDGFHNAAPLAGYLDDTKTAGDLIFALPVLGGLALAQDRAFVSDHAWIVAIGDNLIRSALRRDLASAGAILINAVHPTAQISKTAVIGHGIYFGAFSSVGSNATVEDGAIVEVHSHLGVDVRVGEAAFIGPGSILAGGSSVGPRSFIGAATVVSNNVAVGSDCVVGANSLVLRNVSDGISVFGSPARRAELKRRPLLL